MRINQLTKQYKSKTAVNNLSVTLTPGIYGLLGANGAGKTTLMRMLCDILDPTSGSITYNGMDIRQAGSSYRNRIGYLPQDFGYYPNMTAPDFLLYVAALKHLPSDEASARTGTLLKAVGLSDIGKKKIKTFSGGMKQRLGIAQTFLNDPAVLILDEPTAGLDPKERIRFRNMIQDFSENRIILFSTHIVSDIEHIATDILIMKEGSLLYKGRPQDISTTLEDFLATDFVMERLVDDYGVLHSVKDLTGMDELPRLEMADFYVETVHDIGSSMMFLFGKPGCMDLCCLRYGIPSPCNVVCLWICKNLPEQTDYIKRKQTTMPIEKIGNCLQFVIYILYNCIIAKRLEGDKQGCITTHRQQPKC
ncbi:ABC transporter ATP-binding protein [Sellimonas caecigallum]|uniref:ABC transporter ATP-binding protein n=1 Tax=Sellimonas caecigallum TaxID=2592333 RepID=UPI002ED109FA